MSDRLAELRRQRALLEENLAWIDREIAAEAKQVSVARVVAPPPVTPGPSVASPARTIAPAPILTTVPEATSAPPDAIFDQYRVAPDSLKSDVRKGCFLYFTLALLLVGLGVAVLWMALRK